VIEDLKFWGATVDSVSNRSISKKASIEDIIKEENEVSIVAFGIDKCKHTK